MRLASLFDDRKFINTITGASIKSQVHPEWFHFKFNPVVLTVSVSEMITNKNGINPRRIKPKNLEIVTFCQLPLDVFDIILKKLSLWLKNQYRLYPMVSNIQDNIN